MLRIAKKDYVEMEVKTLSGEWVKKDVLKTLEGGGAIYLEGTKHSDGTYSTGMVVPATAYKALPTCVTHVRSIKEIVNILVDDGYKPNDTGDWEKRGETTFDVEMFDYCGREHNSIFSWEDKWLEEVEVTPQSKQYGSDTPESPIFK